MEAQGDLQKVTLCIVVKDSQILLGRKKQKLGKGKYNGFGGKVEPGETIDEAALRELNEETGGKYGEGYGLHAKTYQRVGEITYIFPHKPMHNQIMYIYLVTKWEGILRETDEITIEWFDTNSIPYDEMWENDREWLKEILQGKKVRGRVYHTNDEKTINAEINIVDNL